MVTQRYFICGSNNSFIVIVVEVVASLVVVVCSGSSSQSMFYCKIMIRQDKHINCRYYVYLKIG